VIASLADIADADRISIKRTEKMADRTHAWLRDTLEHSSTASSVFATALPLENVLQRLYFSDIADEYLHRVSGLILHAPQTALDIPGPIQHLPRICISDPPTPHALLSTISRGVDMVTVPFVSQITEQGIAFNFTFPPPSSPSTSQLPLGTDMWLTSHASDISPLSPCCTCYSCTRHHRAYLHHLLQAKEMLAWTLLQVHNFHVLDQFFAAVRQSISAGTFDKDARRFAEVYEPDFMAGEGKERGPRLRGYQMKSVGKGEDRKREKVWGRFEDQDGESGTQSPSKVGVEDDMDRKVVEAVESGAVDGAEPLGEVKQ
jgi:queuine tRNA-ribosyltransferase accessory subunit